MSHPVRVLIIDDNRDACETICKLLDRRGVQSTCAHTMEEGIRCFALEDFKCVALDIFLPDCPYDDGAVKHIPEFAPVPVVAMTGGESRALIRKCALAGAELVLKGSDSHLLIDAIMKSIERYSPSRLVEEAIVWSAHEQRAMAADAARATQAVPPPRILSWVPLLSFTLALIIASLTGGAFLFRSISQQGARDAAQASRDEKTSEAITMLSASMATLSGRVAAVEAIGAELKAKILLAEQERNSLKHDLELQSKQQDQYRGDVLLRLGRIEGYQLDLLKNNPKK